MARSPAGQDVEPDIVIHNVGRPEVVVRRMLNTGVFMMHCHMMNHEELGMMQTVEVYKD